MLDPVTRRATAEQRALMATYASSGSIKAAADALGIPEAACRRRLQRLYRRIGAANAVQAAWLIWGSQKEPFPSRK